MKRKGFTMLGGAGLLLFLVVLAGCMLPGPQGPVAVIGFSPENPVEGENIEFASLSYDPNPSGQIEKCCWEFSDGTKLQGEKVNHTFLSSGKHWVTLTVKSNTSRFSTTTVEVEVAPRALEYRIDIGSLGSDCCNFYVGDWIEMKLVTDDPKDAEAVWEFGDGNNATGAMVKHSYQKCGVYQIEVRINGSLVCTRRIMIQEPG